MRISRALAVALLLLAAPAAAQTADPSTADHARLEPLDGPFSELSLDRRSGRRHHLTKFNNEFPIESKES